MSNHPLMDDGLDDIAFDEEIDIIEPGDLDILDDADIDIFDPLTEDEARALTDTIRNAVDVVWALIARAHAGGAWKALGYDTWGDYVRVEFDMSRSRSYQLLDQARVVREIESAVPEGTPVRITEAAARDLKGVLEEVVPEIRERTDGLAPGDAADVLDEIVAEQRERLRDTHDDDDDDFLGDYAGGGNGSGGNFGDGDGTRSRSNRPDAFDDDDGDDVDVVAIRRAVNAAHDLYSSLSALAGLPQDLTDVVDIIPPERYAQIDGNLRLATANLEKFYTLWVERRGDDFETEID